MNDKKSENIKEDSTFSSDSGPIHDESNDVSQPNAKCSDKKSVTTDTDGGSAQHKQHDIEETGTSLDEDFSLRLESSDEETFKDAIDTFTPASKEIKIDVKSAISNKSDTLFSDIESSDDSIVYEPKIKSAVSPGKADKSEEKANPETAIPTGPPEKEKVIESEFDPVESDEEFFEDLPLPEKTEQLSQETVSDKTMQEEEEAEEEERSSTPLVDEENDKSTELGLQSEGVSMNLIVESSEDIPEQIIKDSTDSVSKDNAIAPKEIETKRDGADDRIKNVDENESSIVSVPVADVIEDTNVLPSSSLSLKKKEERPSTKPDTLQTDVATSQSSSPAEETSFDSPPVSSSIRSTDKKSEELIEAVPSDLDSSENSEKLQEVSDDPQNKSSKILPDDPETMETDVEMPEEGNFDSLENSKELQELEQDHEDISPLVQPETMETEVEIETEELNLDGDNMEENLLTHEINDSIASENEKLEEEEFMEIDETILEVSGVSDLATIEGDTTVKETDNESFHENESEKPVEKEAQLEGVDEQEINLKSKETREKNKDIAKISDTDEQMRSQQKSTEPLETAKSQCLPDIEETEKSKTAEESNNEGDSNKADDSNETLLLCDSIEEPAIIESEKENPDEVIEKSDALPIDDADETEKLLEINPSTLDDDTANKEMKENTEKSPKLPTKCLEDKKDGKETTSEMQNTDIDEIPSNEKQESHKEVKESVEKSEASESDAPEKKLAETSHESNKKAASLEEVLSSVEESREKEESLDGKKLETSDQSSKQTNQQTAEKEESIIETVSLVDESDAHEIDSMETNESLQNEDETSEKSKTDTKESPQSVVEQIEKSAELETDSNEKPKSLHESAVFQETDSVEKLAAAEESALSQKAESIDNQGSRKETASLEKIAVSQETDSIEKVASNNESTVSQKTADSKKSEEPESIKSSEVTSSNKETLKTPTEVPAEVSVEKVVTSIETTKSKEINDAKVDLEIIEIDDDDDLEEEKKLEDTSKKDEKASSSSTNEKELQEKKIDDVTNKSENVETKTLVTPMDIDAEITTEKQPQKPSPEDQSSNQTAKTDQESSAKDDDVTMKGIPDPALDDDDEPLLMIDTSHKEDNDTESNFMDNETATSAPTTDSSSDGSLEVFYDKECVNYECKRTSKNFYRAAVFALNYFKISKKRSKTQFVCEECYDRSLSSYEEMCKTLKMKQPLLHGTTFKCQEFVEIIDSSDEDESDTGGDKVKVSDENALPKESIEMLEAELEGAIRKVMHSVDIQNQLSWTKQILQQRLTNLQEDSDFVSEQLRALQRKADHMHNSLYQCPKIKLRQLTPLDLNSGRMYNPESDNSSSIPLPGDIIRNPICVNEQYYAVKTKAIASWVPCKVIEEVEGYQVGYNTTKSYKIKFTKLAKYPMFKTVFAKHMAYYDPPNVRLPIGSRVIAYFDATSLSRGKEKMMIPSAFYPGIIAEPLKQSNKFRYLVFYDDGYFQYVNHKDVRLVCQASENVWEDVHHQSREFIHNYLTQYAVNRPMVQTQKGQSMLVDYNGKWIYARVIDVDCSLVQMLFEGQSRSEWIYRGSTRLGPVYKESNNLSQKNTLNATRRRTEPFIRYFNGDDSSSSQQVQETETPQTKTGSTEIRSVAKKSVSRVDTSNNNNSTASSAAQPVPTVRHLNNSTIFVDDDNKPKGKVVYYTARKNLPPRNYVPHICNPSCPFNITHNLSFYSPLAKPLLSGWERQVFRQKSKKFIVYRGPCGKRMRNIEELHRYLRVTENELNVDNFDFSPDTNCLAEYVLEKCLVNKKDISCGKEKMPIPCVNYYDETMPPACEYSAVRIPTEGVPLNLDEEFLCGCDCEDDCSDKTKCACWQLTYAGAKYGMPTVPTEMVGYQYKRLYEHVPTGIYECNSRCKCKANCVNRVVQQPLQSKLQVFKTSNRGWGLRCINDVPRGSFICVYAGQMLTEQVANEGGLDAGDEYFAELDYIEVAEQIKEGYESDVQEPEEDEDFYNPEREDDDIDFRAPGESFKDKEFNTRLRARRGNKNSTDGEFDSQERQVISFEPNKNMDTSNEPNEKPTIRKLFGKDESCYVMDAKVRGNLGRYFNHSCSPNLFVQNVFVDTHDLRFPWVAFFASTHIRAGTELTWNYNYEVGVVPGKVLYCQCGAPNCRQRLL